MFEPPDKTSNFQSNTIATVPKKRGRSESNPLGNVYSGLQRQIPGPIEQNTSYTRGTMINDMVYPTEERGISRYGAENGQIEGNESDEDERFLRLAREALVATATGTGSIDPTIQDLFRRLQYASSPHGNPIKRSERIKANDKGQLMIQGFYQQFPDLSNDVFMDGNVNNNNSFNHPSNSKSDDWNFLVDKSNPFHSESLLLQQIPTERKLSLSSSSEDPIINKSSDSLSESRKFLCAKCSMSFRRSSDLKRHEKQHLKIPPNICRLCGKGFARKDALKRHMGTQTCKRNAEKSLYLDNLDFLKQKDNSAELISSLLIEYDSIKP